MFRGDLRTFLLADGTIAGLVGTRVFPIALPQGTAFPAITYSEISGTRVRGLCGPAGRARPRVSLSLWSKSYDQAHQLANAVRAALSGYRGMMGSTEVDDAYLDNEFDEFEDEVKVYRIVQDYIISYVE